VAADRLERAFREHGRRVYHYCLTRAGSRAEAEDVASETFARFAQHQSRVPEDATLRWLLKVAGNACVDAARLHRRQTALEDSGAEQTPDPAPGPERVDPGLWAAMRALPPKQQTVVYLRAVEDLPFRDVAALLGIAEPAAKMRYRRALDALGRSLGGER